MIREEGLENSWARHQRHHVALKAGLEAMGLKFLVKEPHRLPQMNAVFCPEGVDEAEVRKTLLEEFNLEIGAGLGPLKGKIWRFGIMGYSCRPDNVMLCLAALGSVLSRHGPCRCTWATRRRLRTRRMHRCTPTPRSRSSRRKSAPQPEHPPRRAGG